MVGRHEAYYCAKKHINITNLPPMEQDGEEPLQHAHSNSSSSSGASDTITDQCNSVSPSAVSCPSPCSSSATATAAAAGDDDDDYDSDGCCSDADDVIIITNGSSCTAASANIAVAAAAALDPASHPIRNTTTTTSSSSDSGDTARCKSSSSSSSSSGSASAGGGDANTSVQLQLQAGELIHIEYSYKYSQQEIHDLCSAAGLRVKQYWLDSKQQYGLYLMTAATRAVDEQTEERDNEGLGAGGALGFSGAATGGGFAPGDSGKEQQQEQKSARTSNTAAGGGGLTGEIAVTKSVGASVPTWEDWQQLWRYWDAATLDMIPSGTHHHLDQPISLRHPFIFYVGHTPAFVEARLAAVVPGWERVQPEQYRNVFSRGIDPDVDDSSKCKCGVGWRGESCMLNWTAVNKGSTGMDRIAVCLS